MKFTKSEIDGPLLFIGCGDLGLLANKDEYREVVVDTNSRNMETTDNFRWLIPSVLCIQDKSVFHFVVKK